MMINGIPKSALVLLAHLDEKEPMAPRQMSKRFNIPLRTVSFALKRLRENKLIVRVPNLFDMRQPLYRVNNEHVRELRKTLEEIKIKTAMHMRAI
jgi:DNA-binding transcriptional ArsR family regulator